MSSPLEIAIPTATTVSPAEKPFTVYNISLRQPLRSLTIQKRYSDFVSLNDALISETNGTSPPASLPPKTWLKKSVNDPSLTETRRTGLEAYLRAINDASDAKWRNSKAFRNFLNLPSGNAVRASDASTAKWSNSNGSSGVPSMDPTVWLDVLRDLKLQLRDSRQHVSARDLAQNTYKQHEESAEAQKSLVRAGTMLSTLDKSLKDAIEYQGHTKPRSSSDLDGMRELGQGELRRRQDLLSAAARERDLVEQSLHDFSKVRAMDDTQASSGQANSERTELLKSVQTSGRRVIGGPLKETEQTKPLDNKGVLQLQKQIMEQQDLDVGEITKTVQRMKQMGVQINNELELQNEMLGLLDNDVDRVTGKIDIAKKRINKIQ